MGMIMFDDFFIRALFAGIGLAVIVGPLGCLIIWRKMAFLAIHWHMPHFLALLWPSWLMCHH